MDHRKQTLLLGLLIFSILTAVYSLTYSGIPRIEDEMVIAARAQSFANWDEFSFPQLYGNDRIRHLAIAAPDQADFDVATDPGQSWLASALFRLALTLNIGGTQAGMTVNLYLTALTGVLVFLTILNMGYQAKTSVFGGLVFGLGTMVWPFSKTLFRDGLLMFFVSSAALGLSLRSRKTSTGKIGATGLMAIGIAGSILAKRTGWVLVPALILTLVFLGSIDLRKRWRPVVMVVVGGTLGLTLLVLLVPPQGVLARFSFPHFRMVFQRITGGFGETTLLDILGPFLSPGKSVFLFSPVLLLAPFGLVLGWKRHKSLYLFSGMTIGFLVLTQALFYRGDWAGIPIWGTRFMLLALPLMVYMMAPILERGLSTASRLDRWVLTSLLMLSAFVQLAGSVVMWTVPLLEWSRQGWDPYALNSVWNFKNSPIPIHITSLVEPTNFDMAWFRTLPQTRMTLLIPLAVALLAAMGVIFLVRAMKRSGTTWGLIRAILVASLALSLPIAQLTLLHRDPGFGGDRPEFDAMLSWVDDRIAANDLVIVDSYGTSIWLYMLNRWNAPAPWFSLPYDYWKSAGDSIDLDDLPSDPFEDLLSTKLPSGHHLIYILTSDVPDFTSNTELKTLKERFPLVDSTRLIGEGAIEVWVFGLGG